MSKENIQDDAERKELREDAKKALTELWEIDRYDFQDGNIIYRVVSAESQIIIASIDEETNPNAKATADHICEMQTKCRAALLS